LSEREERKEGSKGGKSRSKSTRKRRERRERKSIDSAVKNPKGALASLKQIIGKANGQNRNKGSRIRSLIHEKPFKENEKH
jgi:hypothetical protein